MSAQVFNRDWQAYEVKPIEWRPIYAPTSRMPQGKLQAGRSPTLCTCSAPHLCTCALHLLSTCSPPALHLLSARYPHLIASQLWVDVMPEAEAASTPMWDITPAAEQAWEARVIVWQTAEVPAQDTFEGLTDMCGAARAATEGEGGLGRAGDEPRPWSTGT